MKEADKNEDDSGKYVKKEDKKHEVPDLNGSEFKVPKEKSENNLKTEMEDKLNNSNVNKEMEQTKSKSEINDTQNTAKPDVAPTNDDTDVHSKSEDVKNVEAVDLMTVPKETEQKTIRFKTPEVIKFRKD